MPDSPSGGYLRVDDQWIRVRGVSVGASTDYIRPVAVETTLSGRRRAQVSTRPARRDWQIRLGLADAEVLFLWESLVNGAYGIGPFDWIDPFTSVTVGGPDAPFPTHRPVVITNMSRSDRTASRDQQLTSISITLSEVGIGV